jgi:hypothetical protein
MSNTLGGISLALAAQETLPALSSVFAPLRGIVSDLSKDVVRGGTTIVTRIPTKPTAGTLTSYAPTDVTLTAVTITLPSDPTGFVAGFTDSERSRSAVDLDTIFIAPLIESVGDYVFATIWNLVTAANFSTSTTITAANFDRSDLADIGATLTSTLSTPKNGRTLWAAPGHYASLVKSLNGAEFPGQTTDKAEGTAPRTAGFNCYEASGADANSENLAAFAFHKSALCMAARGIDATGAGSAGVEVMDLEIPGIGIPVQFRRWYSPDAGKLCISAAISAGFAKGTGMGVRIVTA